MLVSRHARRTLAAALGLLASGIARNVHAAALANSISVSGDSIARGYDANTSSCNYGDNVSRSWATGDDHGTSFCSAGPTGTYSHAERLECAAGGNITNFNDARTGATMLGDFASQATTIKMNLSSSLAPRYVPVFMGHNDACSHTTSRTGNSCSGDSDPNNYCRPTNAAFEREFRRGLDQLIQIPSVRVAVLALVRISELCNFGSKSSCGAGFGAHCSSAWGTFNICESLTTDCSDQRRIDMYNTLVGYNEVLERVTGEYAAIPTGGLSATGAVKAPDVQLKFGIGSFNYQFSSADISCCDCFHPADGAHAKLAEFSWNGLQCSPTIPCCAASGDPLTNASCSATDTTTFYPGGFWPSCTSNADCDDHDPCSTDTCDGTGVCQHAAAPDGTACTDGNACTQTDTCQGGTCVGANAVVCTAQDQCHVAGTCDPATGTCSNPNASNGLPCNDGNACSQTDTCQAGTCTGGSFVVCSASDQCHDAGTCNPSTGACSNPARSNGAACNDGNACTQTDTCQAGICTGSSAVTCTAQDQCHDAGVCNPSTGACTNPAKTDGTACNDGNACTQTDTCQSGTCTGANAVVCSASDQCHDAGTCNPATGACSNPAKPNGISCNDADACTQTDTCQGGVCTGSNAVVCPSPDQCHTAGTCNPSTGVCSNPAKPNGSACNDGNACTQTDTCQGGTCTGANPVVCVADQCHTAGTCNPSTGVCSNPAKPNGTACNDGNLCTQSDACQAGVCTGANAVVCPAPDQCHDPGTCNPSTGVCSNPPKPNGSACDDGSACTQTDTCQGGTCTGGNAVVCPAPDQCHDPGTCDVATGVCSNPSKADGTACNDGNACTQTDACQGGTCTGGNSVVCPAPDQCHDAGTCSPSTGACSNPAKPDGTACDDGNACTAADHCTAGMCGGDSTTCGDGVVQPGCGEQCDDGPGNGTDHCCAADCRVIDHDGDGVCDRDDPCTGPAAIGRSHLSVKKLGTPPGDDALSFKADVTLPSPFDPALEPLTNGIRLIVAGTRGTIVDVTVPGGAYADPPRRGWTAGGTITRYVDRSGAPLAGITGVVVQDRSSRAPGLVRVTVKGKGGAYPVSFADFPLAVEVILDPPTAETGECGDVRYVGPPPAPACAFNGSGTTLTCK